MENCGEYGKLWKIMENCNLWKFIDINGNLWKAGKRTDAHGNLWKIIKLWKFMEKIKVMDIYRQ